MRVRRQRSFENAGITKINSQNLDHNSGRWRDTRLLRPALDLLLQRSFFPQLTTPAKTAPLPRPFQRIEGCILQAATLEYGLSFHDICRIRKSSCSDFILWTRPRGSALCRSYRWASRVLWHQHWRRGWKLGREASDVTNQALAKPFTISPFLSDTYAILLLSRRKIR